MIFRIDDELAIRALGVAIQNARSEETVIERGKKSKKKGDSQGGKKGGKGPNPSLNSSTTKAHCLAELREELSRQHGPTRKPTQRREKQAAGKSWQGSGLL